MPEKDFSKPAPLAVRPAEAARLLSVSTRTLWSWIKAGLLPIRKFGTSRGSAVLIPVAAIEAFLNGDAKGGEK